MRSIPATRWLRPGCLRAGALLAAVLATVCMQVAAQVRTIPADAKRASMRHVHAMVVALDGKSVPLAPGAQIRGPTNLIVLPTAVPDNVLVKYTVDLEGRVFRVWILNPEEAAQRDAGN